MSEFSFSFFQDGFVVISGTDTMAYFATALSFMLENLGKPVVFTGEATVSEAKVVTRSLGSNLSIFFLSSPLS